MSEFHAPAAIRTVFIKALPLPVMPAMLRQMRMVELTGPTAEAATPPRVGSRPLLIIRWRLSN